MVEGKDSFMLDPKSSGIATSTTIIKQRPCFMALALLRTSAILLTAASIAVTVTNSQTVIIFSIQFEAHYYYSSAFKFLVAADAIVCVFSVLTLFIVHLLLRHRGSQLRGYYFYIFLHDTAMTVLLTSGCAATTAIGYVGQYGEEHMGWAAMCDRVRKFCGRSLVSLLLSYLALFAYLGLTVGTVHKLRTPPKQ
ncbi:hypothetical protein L6164_009093 [Bauhinia variegata]|uniref:Uncharacterized protein n=1 Tax=Bauhinia variegata TaxID=167791 RepID=A0ACB9PLL0_BAUVA|nr:hypothetical protein L6164_009093 [Bauhinia variegata]